VGINLSSQSDFQAFKVEIPSSLLGIDENGFQASSLTLINPNNLAVSSPTTIYLMIRNTVFKAGHLRLCDLEPNSRLFSNNLPHPRHPCDGCGDYGRGELPATSLFRSGIFFIHGA